MSMMIQPFRFGSAAPAVDWSPKYDVISGSTVVGAWGLRKLVSGYSGSAVRIRDTTGGAEQDVGFGADGYLASFTVTGNAAVVTLYDQSGNANHLTQTDTTKQPLVVRPGVSFSGRPAIRFDGSNDFLHDATTGTAKAYMVANPVIAIEGAGLGTGGSSWAPWASVPHIAGSNTSPFDRWSLRKYSSSLTDVQVALSGASAVTSAITGMELVPQKSIGNTFIAAYADIVLDGTVSLGGPAAPAATVTYPNATGIRLGANGAGGECTNGEITAVVVLSNAAASAATVQTWHDNINQKSLAKVNDKVLDITFTGATDPVDTSDRGHPVWLSDGASVSAGYLNAGSVGAAVVASSGLISPVGNFTFECQINPTSNTVNRRIVSKAPRETSSGWILSTHDVNADEIMLVVGNSYIVTGEHGPQADITTGAWHTVRFTRSGDTWKIYVNAVEKASRTVTPSQPIYSGVPLLIGNNALRTLPFPGFIRNVKIWSGVATPP